MYDAAFWMKIARSVAITLSGSLPAVLIVISGVFGELGTPAGLLIAGALSVLANGIYQAKKLPAPVVEDRTDDED